MDGGRAWGGPSKEASLWTEPTDLYWEYREEVERMSYLSLRNVGLKCTSDPWTNQEPSWPQFLNPQSRIHNIYPKASGFNQKMYLLECLIGSNFSVM